MHAKDYRLIAATIATLGELDIDQRRTVAWRFAAALTDTNPRFDSARFLAAAMGEPLKPGDKPRARDQRRA